MARRRSTRQSPTPFGELRALVHVPPGAPPDAGWPLILFLHGSGERGSDVDKVRAHGVPSVVERRERFPFLTIAPQCPGGRWWTQLVPQLAEGLERALRRYRVDRHRIYLTGMSMGGYGAWKLAALHPEHFAALVTVCGGGEPAWARRLAALPIRAYHGTADEIVPVGETERMVRALRALGAPVEMILYEGVGHDAWTRTYEDPALYDWLLSHRRP